MGVGTPPEVASFSSRGPSKFSVGIIKPDIIAPGVNIIAADTHFGFMVQSGTSMACPHVTGVAAKLKMSHPDWSPAVLRSAMMTTTDHLNIGGEPILDERRFHANMFAIGCGHVNYVRANDPGLVFDIEPEDYISDMFDMHIEPQDIESIINCPVKYSEWKMREQLNYPSFYLILVAGQSKTCRRSVRNVGQASAVYKIKIDDCLPRGVKVDVILKELRFTSINEKLTYIVSFECENVETDGCTIFSDMGII